MNKKNIISIFVLSLISITLAVEQNKPAVDIKDTFFIDGSKVTVLGEIRDHVICDSELNSLSAMDGKKLSVDDLIKEELIYQDAEKHKVPLQEQAERHEAKIIEMYKIPEGQIDSIYHKSGMTREEGFQKLCKMAATSIMTDIKVKSRIFIPHNALEEYNEQHPRYKEAKYELEIAFMPFINSDAQKQKNQLAFLNEQIKNKSLDIMWTDPFWIRHNDLENSKKFIAQLHVGEISVPYKSAEGFELYRLKSKKEARMVPLTKRLKELTDKLREPKMVTMYEDYIAGLRKNAFIIMQDTLVS